jgi:DNA-binding SARP family transcriptional activator
MLVIRTLGGLSAEADGSPVSVPAGRCASLLAWLALHPGMQPRSRVAARLWPEVLDESARASLRTALLDLRRAFGPAAARHLQSTRDEIGLGPPEEVWVDVAAFAAAAQEGRREEALALAAGELLPGLDQEWVFSAREAHAADVARLLEQLAAAAEAAGDLEAAVEHTRRLTALDPLAEEPTRALIRRLTAAGDRAAALAAYDRHRERLRSDLGVAPSAPTRQLVEEIRSADAPAAAEPAPLPQALVRHTAKPLFGRATELDRLTDRWQRTGGGGGLRCVMLAGEAGAGKTRLLAELCRRAQADGGTVLYGRCHEDAAFPYAPFVEALRAYVAALPPGQLPQESGAGLAPLVPQLAGGAVPPPGGNPDADALRLFDGVVALLVEAVRSGAVLLALDDLHWADRPTLRLLEHVSASAAEAAILVVGTYRDTELVEEVPLSATLSRLRRERLLEEVEVGGLDQPDVTALVHAYAGEAPNAELVEAVVAQTGGNPYFVEELVGEIGDVASAGAAARLAGADVPQSLRDVIARRLTRLPGGVSDVVSAAAVLGVEFDATTLSALVDVAEGPLLEALEAALGARLVVELPGGPGRFAFEHALVRATLYGRLSATRRARLHGRAAEAIAERHADDLADRFPALARHHALAGDLRGALRYRRLAADAAASVHAAESALEHYSGALRAAAALGLGESDRDVYEARLRRSVLRQRAGDLRGALEDAVAAAAGAGTAGDVTVQVQALDQCGYVQRFHDPQAAIASHEAALAVAERAGDVRAQVAPLARLSIIAASRLRLDQAVDLGDRALALAGDAGDPEAIGTALDAVKLAALQIGDLERLDAATAQLLELHRRAGDEWGLHWLDDWVLLERAFIPIATGRWDEAHAAVEAALDANRRLRNRFAEPIFLDARAWLACSRGDHEAAVRHGLDALGLAEELGGDEWIAWTSATLGWALLEAGRAVDAAVHLAGGREAALAIGAHGQLLRCTGLLAWATAETGERDAAAALAGEAEAMLARVTAPPGRTFLFGAHATLAVARAWLQVGEPDRARGILEPLRAAAEEAGWIQAQAAASELLAATAA